jgi:hypothetical protein
MQKLTETCGAPDPLTKTGNRSAARLKLEGIPSGLA